MSAFTSPHPILSHSSSPAWLTGCELSVSPNEKSHLSKSRGFGSACDTRRKEASQCFPLGESCKKACCQCVCVNIVFSTPLLICLHHKGSCKVDGCAVSGPRAAKMTPCTTWDAMFESHFVWCNAPKICHQKEHNNKIGGTTFCYTPLGHFTQHGSKTTWVKNDPMLGFNYEWKQPSHWVEITQQCILFNI